MLGSLFHILISVYHSFQLQLDTSKSYIEKQKLEERQQNFNQVLNQESQYLKLDISDADMVTKNYKKLNASQYMFLSKRYS